MVFPTLDTVVVLQKDFANEAIDCDSCYILHIDLRLKKQRVFKFRHLIKTFEMRSED